MHIRILAIGVGLSMALLFAPGAFNIEGELESVLDKIGTYGIGLTIGYYFGKDRLIWRDA